jgi:hypothetical protein
MDEASGLYEFVGFGELAETTTQLLALSLHHTAQTGGEQRGDHNQVAGVVLRQARDYLRKVREGFMLSVRAGQLTHPQEARFLLDRVLRDWATLSQELGLDAPDDGTAAARPDDAPQVERVRHQLLAFGMAVVALGQLPRLPAKQVTFPHSYGNPPTYCDIPVPASPGEMLWRIEELEQTVWRLMSDDLHDLVQRRYGPLRRTYGFFEAGAWISRQDAVRFGVKKPDTRWSGF